MSTWSTFSFATARLLNALCAVMSLIGIMYTELTPDVQAALENLMRAIGAEDSVQGYARQLPYNCDPYMIDTNCAVLVSCVIKYTGQTRQPPRR